MIQSTFVKELTSVIHDRNRIMFAASVTLTRLEDVCKEQFKALPEWKVRVFAAPLEMRQSFGGKQIRNVASIGRNIMTGGPISDLNPILMSAKCSLQIVAKEGSRQVLSISLSSLATGRI